MANKSMYIEKRPDGTYALSRENAERASAITQTQREAIDRAKALEPDSSPRVERVRDTGHGKPGEWRKA